MTNVLLYQYPRGVNKGGILYLDYLPTITTSSFENNLYLVETMKYTIVASRGRKNNIDRNEQSYELQNQDLTNTITSVYKDNIVMEEQMMQEPVEARPKGKGWRWIPEEKCWVRLRRLTPRECFRLMGVSETDIDKIQNSGVSNSQQYKLAGNSIVTNCLYDIFRKMFVEKESEHSQLTLF